MGPIDSPTLHGKLWVSEDDTRTSVSKQPAGCVLNGVTHIVLPTSKPPHILILLLRSKNLLFWCWRLLAW